MVSHKKHLVPGTLVHEVENGMVQVGSNPKHSVLFSGLSNAEISWLKSLRDVPFGGGSRQRRASEDLTGRQEEALRLLGAAGLLDCGEPRMRTLRIRVVGLNDVGIRIARILAEIRIKHIEVRDPRFVDSDCELLFPSSAKGQPRERATREMIRDISPNTCLGKIAVPDLAIVCSERTIDFGIVGLLLSHDTPHVPVVLDDRQVTVGPLVVPGQTACALCAELHSADRIPGLGYFADALRRSGPCRSVSFISTMAAAAVVNIIDAVAANRFPRPQTTSNSDPEQPSSTSTAPTPLLRVGTEGITTQYVMPHADCGCIGLNTELVRAN
ncbi:hypothetical protein U6G28_10325 [Actinomycetaceae bacterium MB13-C1-2]|nr:hypothetical protein U6G28_10325 [Actinomycetaceae bacterium MB13-C1-2]